MTRRSKKTRRTPRRAARRSTRRAAPARRKRVTNPTKTLYAILKAPPCKPCAQTVIRKVSRPLAGKAAKNVLGYARTMRGAKELTPASFQARATMDLARRLQLMGLEQQRERARALPRPEDAPNVDAPSLMAEENPGGWWYRRPARRRNGMPKTCPRCHGMGVLYTYPRTKTWGQVIRTKKCPKCRGTGVISGR